MSRLAICMIIFVVSASLASSFLEAAENLDYVSFLDYLDSDRAWSIVSDLAGDRFEGRRASTRNTDLASEYITGYFDSIGLKPAGEDGTYRTRFTHTKY